MPIIPRAITPPSGLSAALATLGEQRRTIVVDTVGNTVGLLANAQHGPVTWQLNQPIAGAFTMQADDPEAALLFDEKFREVQMWIGEELLVWGPVVLMGMAGATLSFQVQGPSWYLGKRYVGPPERPNLLINPGFETDTAGWEALQTRYFYNVRQARAGTVTVNEIGDGVAIEQDLTPHTLAQTGTSYGTRVVVPGDTLWGIATEFYGSGLLWRRIYDANQAQIEADARAAGLWDPRDPGHWIFPGQVFDIPDVEAEDVSNPVTSNTEWGTVWLFQEFEIFGGVRGNTVTLSAWALVRSDEFTGYGLHKDGLYLARLPSDYRVNNFFTQNGRNNSLDGYRGLYSEPCEGAVSPIDELHPFDQWVRHEVQVTVPPGVTEIVHCRLSGVQGRTQWRLPRVTEDTAEEFFEVDQAAIVSDLVTHAQDPAFGKSDINLVVAAGDHDTPRTLVAFHHDHDNIWGLIRDMAQLDDGYDVREVFTPTTRTLVLDHPRSGDYRGHKRMSSSGTVTDWTYTFQGDAAANSIGKMAATRGAGREERAALDADAFDNGLILESVTPTKAGTSIDRLQGIANEELAVGIEPEVYSVITEHERVVEFLGGGLLVGDWVPVDLVRRGFSVNNVCRVTSMTLLPSNAWTVELQPSAVPVGGGIVT